MTVLGDLQQSRSQFKDAACSLIEVIAMCSATSVDRRACGHTRAFAAMLLVHLTENGNTVRRLMEIFGSEELKGE